MLPEHPKNSIRPNYELCMENKKDEILFATQEKNPKNPRESKYRTRANCLRPQQSLTPTVPLYQILSCDTSNFDAVARQ